MKKKILSLALAVTVIASLITVFPVITFAYASGTCGANLTWKFSYDKLTISGTGNMTDWSSYSYVPWCSARLSIKTIVIQSGVTSIGKCAFAGCSNLASITIPDSVTNIGDNVFQNCNKLPSVTIENGVTSIGKCAFYYCSSLTSITIPDSVTSIGESAFCGCSSLESITLPFVGGSINSTNSCFGYIFGTSSYTGSYNANNYYIPSSLKTVKITNVTQIPNNAFKNCSSLTSFDIPDSVTSIGSHAFSGCSNLSKIIIPTSVSEIEEYAFDDCPKLTIYCKTGSVAETYASEHVIPTKISGFDAVLNKIGNNIIVTANVPDDDISKNIHTVLYSSNGAMLDYMIYPAEYSNNTVHFMFKNMPDLSYIKVFLWNGFENIMPLDESIVLNINK